MEGYILYNDLMKEVGATSGSMAHHIRVGNIPKPEKYLNHRVYGPDAQIQVRGFYDGRRPWQPARVGGKS